MAPGPSPTVSVVVPAYRSHRTVAGCLAALAAQTLPSHEVLVVDSGPGEETERIVREGFPWVRYLRSGRRLFPHAARNLGVEQARAELLVFTDPDVYARPDWLARLVAGYQATGEVVVGAIECFGERWLDQGIHLCKFSKWLPAQRPRPVDMSPTANMLVSRRHFDAAGGFLGDQLLGDVSLSRRLVAGGRTLWLQPDAVVEHHHLHRLGSFLAERYQRGRLFGELRCASLPPGRGGPLGYLLVTVLPIRLPRILALVAMHSARAGRVRRYLSTLPVVAAGHAASLGGETVTYARRLAGADRVAGLPRMAGEPGEIHPP